MATTIAEPNDLPNGTITDENAGRFAILVYQKAQDDAGIKTMNIAEWKSFMNYNGFKVNNLASYIGVEDDYNWQADNDNPYTGTPITDRIKNIAEQAGVSTEPVSGVTPLNERIETLEGYVKDGWDDSGTSVDGLLSRVDANETDIESIKEEIGSGGGGSSSSLTGRVSALETTVGNNSSGLVKSVNDINTEIGDVSTEGTIKNDIKQLKDKVGDNSSGLVKDVSDIQNTLGDGTTDGLVKSVNTINAEIGDDATEGTIKGDIKIIQDKIDSAYCFKGNITAVVPSSGTTTALIVDGRNFLVSELKHGDTFNIKPNTGNTITITLNSTSQTYYSDANIAWVKKEGENGYFDELGTSIDKDKLKTTEDIVDGRFVKLTNDLTNWSSTSLSAKDGLYCITAIQKIGSDIKIYSFIDYIYQGYSKNKSPHSILGTFADIFELNSSTGKITIKEDSTLVLSQIQITLLTLI